MRKALDEIEMWLRASQRTGLLTALQSGLDPATVREGLSALGLPHSAELESLYGWRNGSVTESATIGDLYLFPGYYFISFEEAVENYRSFIRDERWARAWFPFLADGGGDFYVLDFRESPPRVRHFWIDDSAHPIEYESIATLIETVRQAYAEKVIFVDGHGHLEMDDAQFYRIASTLNPRLAHWAES